MTQVLDLLEQLIASDSRNPGGDELRIAGRLQAHLERHRPDCLELRRVPRPRGGGEGAWVYASWGTPRLLLNAHLDTVPVAEGWQGDPLAMRRLADRAVGLGTADTKGAIAVILAALETVSASNVAVLFSGDEEAASSCMDDFLRRPPASLRTVRQAIVCEPTGCQVGTRHRGIVSGEVQVAGVGGHSSRSDQLPAPIWEISRVAARLGEWGQGRRALGPEGFQGLCLNLASIGGGSAYNIIPSRGTLSFSLRQPPGEGIEPIQVEIERLVREVAPSAELRWGLAQPSLSTQAVEAFEPFLGEACRRPVDLGFWTEAALLERAGISSVVYGPGQIEQAHLAGEWVLHSQLEAAHAAFVNSLSRLQEVRG